MAAPNLINASVINGKTVGANLTTTNATTVLNNAASSGKCLKVNTLTVTNTTSATALITITYYTGANVTGTAYPIASNIAIPQNAAVTVIQRVAQYYLEENTSLGATAGTANALIVTCSYEDIS